MTIHKQAEAIMEAYDSLWMPVVEEILLFHVPEDEHIRIMAILRHMRSMELQQALRYSKYLGNPKKRDAFIQKIKQVSELTAGTIKQKLT